MADNKIRTQVRNELLKYYNECFEKFIDDEGIRPYYHRYYNNNILPNNLVEGKMNPEHKKMFDDGSGGELKDEPAKAKAIDSSSMLSYNFFSFINENNPLEIDEIKYSKVFFEVQLRTLKARSNPANLDVVLLSYDEKTALFIESKFLEYLESGNVDFSPSYTKESSYYAGEDNKDLISMSKGFDNKAQRYNYGIKQNICHLIGISNLATAKEAQEKFKEKYNNKEGQIDILEKAERYLFMNMIFEPKVEEASKKMRDYYNELISFKESLPKALNKYINKSFIMTYKDLYDKLPESELKSQLYKKYIQFHK